MLADVENIVAVMRDGQIFIDNLVAATRTGSRRGHRLGLTSSARSVGGSARRRGEDAREEIPDVR
jgi:hypothetical protein